MSLQTTIENKLSQQFSPTFCQVENESHMHSKGSDSHFKVIVISSQFSDLSLLKRHRLVNSCLSDELKNHIHALAIHAFTPNEWEKKNLADLSSPACMGGGH